MRHPCFNFAGKLSHGYMENEKRINSSEGITRLLEDMWYRHKAGIKQPQNNVFWVELPPLTDEEKAAIEAEKAAEERETKENDDNPDPLNEA